MWRASELNKEERLRFENIIDMGVAWSTMLRLFRKGSKKDLNDRIIKKTAEGVFNVDSREDFAHIHSEFCDWGTRNIFLAQKKRKRRIIKQSKAASYGQIAKTLDVTLKVAVYYCHLPNCETSKKISPWLNAAVDTEMMAKLREQYPNEIKSWPTKIEEVDKNNYLTVQEIVRRVIKEKHSGKIIPVQFDDIYWREVHP